MPSFQTLSLALLASVFLPLSTAWPTQHPEHVNILTRASQIQDEYDYIIVGGGTSGLTVGNRLTEDGKYTVLVVEYGYYDSATGMNPRRMYNITSVPNPGLNNRTFNVGLGAVVGGSSSVNGQVFLRGTREEYNAWKTLGGPNSTWDWDGLLPYFRKGITLAPPDPVQAAEYNITYDMKYWGTTSKIYATFGKAPLRSHIKIMYSAMSKMPGMSIPVDSGAGETGLYWYPMSQDPTSMMRSYARTGHWDGISRPNYEMIVGAKVNRILFDDNLTATGVQFVSRNDTSAPPVRVKARKEVILAAGAVHTPQVLMLSGVGPAPVLKEAGIDVKLDLRGVGSNFQDHSYIRSIGYTWGTAPPSSEGADFGAGVGGPPSLATMIGLPVITPSKFEALAQEYEEQDPATHLPKSYTAEQITGYKAQQKVYAQLMRSTGVTFMEIMLYGPGGSVQNLHCHSRGTILINTTNPEGGMIVDYRAASNPIDLKVMAEIVGFMRRYMTTGELAQYNATETRPGPQIASGEQLIEWMKGEIIPSVYHPIGTCAMMPHELGGVVNDDLLVYGTNRLRVVDASMMPTIVGATTSMTVYAVAEKAADLIKAQTQ